MYRWGLAFVFILVARAAFAAPAEWDAAVAAGEKEGAISANIGTSNAQREFLATEWSKTFPKIKLQLNTVDAAPLFVRIQVERQSGKYLWDVDLTGSLAAYQLKNAGVLDPIQPELVLSDVKDPATWGGWEHVFYDNDHKYVFEAQFYLKVPYYNARMVAPEKIKEKGREIFLDPALKKKIVWQDPLVNGAGESFAPVMLHVLGEDGLKAFVQQQVVFNTNMMDIVDRMARGEYAMALGPVMPSLLARYKKAGVDIDIRPLGNTPEFAAYSNTGGSNLIIFKNRPHPAATRLFLNWFLSKEVAAGFAQAIAQDTSRLDVPSVAPPDEQRVAGVVYDEPQRENRMDEMYASHALIKQFRDEK